MSLLSTDVLDLALGSDRDLVVTDEGFSFTSGADGVAQLCDIELTVFMEEWFLDKSRGMPWYQEILGEKFSPELLRLRVFQKLSKVPGVVGIVSVAHSFDGEARRVSLSVVVATLFGDVSLTTSAGGSGG